MSAFKKSVLWFLFFVILSLLIVAGVSLAFGNSLKYENVKQPIKDFVKNNIYEKISNQELISRYNQAVFSCNSGLQDGFNVQDVGVNISVKCAEINNTNFNSFFDSKVDKIILENYNRKSNYTCPVFLCFSNFSQEGILSFFSKDSQRFFTTQSYYFMGLSVVLLILSFFLFEDRRNFFIYAGGLFILTSLVLLTIDLFFKRLPEQIFNLVSVFVVEVTRIFLILFPLGIVCIIMGLVAMVIHKKK